MTKRTSGAKTGRRRLVVSIVLGVLLAVDVVIAGVSFAKGRPVRWAAEGTLLVLPVKSVTPEALPSFYETLSHGQVVATYAEILRSQRFERAAAQRMGLRSRAEEISVSVKVIPDTAVLVVTATAPERLMAERLAEVVADSASGYVAALNQPYVLTSLQPATGTAKRSELPTSSFAVVVALVALCVGLAVQQAVYQLLGLLGKRRQNRRGLHHSSDTASAYADEPVPVDDLTDEVDPHQASELAAASVSSDHDDGTPGAGSSKKRATPPLEPSPAVAPARSLVMTEHDQLSGP